jgi:hypothetical protein
MRWARLTSAAVLGLCVVAGCAVGTSDEVEDDLTVDSGSSGGIRRDGGVADTGARDTSTAQDASESDGSTATDSGPPDSGNPGAACANPGACGAPLAAGQVSGDTSSAIVTISGATSRWVKIRVNEDDNGIVGSKLKVRATLTSPAGMNFDLFRYDGAPGQCVTPDASATTTGVDGIDYSFGEGIVPNGSDDSKDVYYEVRYVSGTCPPAGSWTLTFQGNY